MAAFRDQEGSKGVADQQAGLAVVHHKGSSAALSGVIIEPFMFLVRLPGALAPPTLYHWSKVPRRPPVSRISFISLHSLKDRIHQRK